MRTILFSIAFFLSGTLIAQKAEILLQSGIQTIEDAFISPDGDYMLTKDGAKTLLWEVKSHRQIRIFDNIWSYAFMPDSRSIFIVKFDGTVSIIDLMGKVLKAYPSIGKIKDLTLEREIYLEAKKVRYGHSLIDLNTGETTEITKIWMIK